MKSHEVVIVGGGLSGLVLGNHLNLRGIDHLVIEASIPGKSPSIHYLTSKASANSLGIGSHYQDSLHQRTPITGYTRFNADHPGLWPSESLLPDGTNRDGFVTFSIAQLREWLKPAVSNVMMGQSVVGIDPTPTREWCLETVKGEQLRTKVLIDATGASARMLAKVTPNAYTIVNKRIVRACFGGVFPYLGPEDQLLFADNFSQYDDQPPEGAGWVMPLGGGQAEVVVGWETPLANVSAWRSPKLRDLLRNYIEWYNHRGIQIDYDRRTEVVSGSFSQGLLDYRRLPDPSKGFILFGEALGLNHPLNGYLINNIANYASTLANEV